MRPSFSVIYSGLLIILLSVARIAIAKPITLRDEATFQNFSHEESSIYNRISPMAYGVRFGDKVNSCYHDLVSSLLDESNSVKFVEIMINIHNSMVNRSDRMTIARTLIRGIPEYQFLLNNRVVFVNNLLNTCRVDDNFISENRAVSSLLKRTIEALNLLEQRNPNSSFSKCP